MTKDFGVRTIQPGVLTYTHTEPYYQEPLVCPLQFIVGMVLSFPSKRVFMLTPQCYTIVTCGFFLQVDGHSEMVCDVQLFSPLGCSFGLFVWFNER